MEVNGTEQQRVVPRVQEPAEEAAGAVIEQSQEQPGTSALDQPMVDRRVFIHAPQNHWHAEGGVDQEARAAIEKLHRGTY